MDKKAIYSSILEFCISTFKPCFLNSKINKFLYFVCVLLRGQGEGVNLDGRRPLNKPVIFDVVSDYLTKTSLILVNMNRIKSTKILKRKRLYFVLV